MSSSRPLENYLKVFRHSPKPTVTLDSKESRASWTDHHDEITGSESVILKRMNHLIGNRLSLQTVIVMTIFLKPSCKNRTKKMINSNIIWSRLLNYAHFSPLPQFFLRSVPLKIGWDAWSPVLAAFQYYYIVKFFINLFLFIYFLWYWGLNSGPIPWATPPALFVLGFFKTRSCELFARAGFEPWSSWSLPPE
jgi:hypothetical protein